jgi:RNA polymerase sigma factor (sigma-70 family)
MDNWIEQLRNGENAAYQELYKKYWRPIVFYAFKILGKEEDAHDAAQFAFIKLFERRKTIECEAHVNNFLYNTCKNKAISNHRLAANNTIEIGEYIENTITEEGESVDLTLVYTRIIEILATLPENYRTAIMKRAERGAYGKDELSNAEYLHICRARKSVIKALKKQNIHHE